MIDETASYGIAAVTGIMSVVGVIMFLLPPVPGVPVYLTLGIGRYLVSFFARHNSLSPTQTTQRNYYYFCLSFIVLTAQGHETLGR